MQGQETLLMTPGPTAVPPTVREAMSQPLQNPDIDPTFVNRYNELLSKLAEVYQTEDDIVILGGEGMLGLEASVASILEPGDDVLCLANGVFGHGFADFVELYDATAHVIECPFDESFDIDEIAAVLEDPDYDFTAATMIHCETPTGVLNDLEPILELLAGDEILTVVDAVSSLGGTSVPTDSIDLCIGGSQKCFSTPPGLTTVSVSDDAWERIDTVEQPTFYASLAPWHGTDPLKSGADMPYTHLVSNLYGLDVALEGILEEGLASVFERHRSVATYCLERGEEIGLERFPSSPELASPTVTAFSVEASATAIQRELYEEYGILIATSVGELEDDIIRIGHMGYQADRSAVEKTMDALASILD